MSITKRKSKWWSAADIRKIKAIIKTAEEEGLERGVGLVRAADHFGVTRNAIVIKLGRLERGIKSSKLNRKTIKIPITRKAVVPKQSQTVNDVPSPGTKISLSINILSQKVPKIDKIIVDFDNKSITYTY
jgi:hypothetical protein